MPKSRNEPYFFTARALVPIERFMAERGLDFTSTAGKFGIPSIDPDPDAVVPAKAMAALLEEAARLANDDAMGAKLGRAAPIGIAGALDYVVLHAPTLRDALQNLTRYVVVSSTVPAVRFDEMNGVGMLTWSTPVAIGTKTQLTDMAIAYTVSRVRHGAGDPNVSMFLEFERRPPKDLTDYELSMGFNCRFNQPVDRLAINSSILDRLLPKADANLYQVISTVVEDALKRRELEADIIHRVSAFVADRLPEGEPNIAETAAALGMSARTLQRELQTAGTKFTSILEDVRRAMAERYLQSTGLPLTEIAFLLGFSELSAFSRAATSWFGMPPREYRKESLRQ